CGADSTAPPAGDMAGSGDGGATAADLATGCAPMMKMCTNMCVAADPVHGCLGASCAACAAAANATATCSTAGGCALQCDVGFGDCDGNPANGCEKSVLADPANCGSCGFACANGALCVNGACQIIMPGMGSDQACLTIDAANVYWSTANATPGAVYSVPKAG